MAIIQVTAPTATTAKFHRSASRAVANLSTLIRYTVNGTQGETYDIFAMPPTGLIHGRVTK